RRARHAAQRHGAPDPRPARGRRLADLALGGHRPADRGPPAAPLLPAHRRGDVGGPSGAGPGAPAVAGPAAASTGGGGVSGPRTPVTGARLAIATAVRALPRNSRERYYCEFVAELYGL